VVRAWRWSGPVGRWAGGLFGLTALFAVAGLVPRLADGEEPAWSSVGSSLLLPLAAAAAGALIIARKPGHVVGPLLAASGLSIALGDAAEAYARIHPSALTAWLGSWVSGAGTGLLLFPLLFVPDGRLPSRRWRPFLIGAGGFFSVLTVAAAITPGPLRAAPALPNPFGVPVLAGLVGGVRAAEPVVMGVMVVVMAAAVLLRHRRAAPEQRRQLEWLVASALLFMTVILVNVVAGVLGVTLPGLVSDGLFLMAVIGFPVALGVAILRHRLLDIDAVLGPALAYGAVSVVLTGLYLAVVTYLGGLAVSPASLVAAALVAVVFAPLRDRLQAVVDRFLHGEREPYRLLVELGQRLDALVEPDAVPGTVAQSVAGTLRLPGAQVVIEARDGSVLRIACHGRLESDPVSLPLQHHGERVGRLDVSRRAPGEEFTRRELRLLADLAQQIAVAASVVRLTDELRASRERLVVSREEERRRLRRDLHDGVGPRLAALSMRLESGRAGLADRPDLDAWADELGGYVRGTMDDLRRAVRGLRPPSLDELGLLGALEEMCARHDIVALHLPETLPQLPAAVEVAAYRIADEAVTNVLRHAHAGRCDTSVTLDDVLVIEVADDGGGFTGRRAGVGMQSMRERAEELGGRLTVETSPAGTRIRAVLPIGGRRYVS
jgi:signal transduction histidine kinase